MCLCFPGYTDSYNKNINGTIIYKCDKLINGFTNKTLINTDNNTDFNNNISFNNNTFSKPSINVYIPDFIVINSSISANGFLDSISTNNISFKNNSDNNYPNFLVDSLDKKETIISPVNFKSFYYKIFMLYFF